MSLTQRVKQGFLRLPVVKKAILLSSAALMISAVMPWYDNRNSFGAGETFLGIQGPLFLVGVLVLAFGALSFFNMFLPLMGRNFFKLKRKSGATAMILGAQSLFLLVVANSVFFHPSFGMNVSHKATRFGMLIAFASIAVMIISGWMTHRKEKAGKFDDIDEFMINPTSELSGSVGDGSSVSNLSMNSPTMAAAPGFSRPVGTSTATPGAAYNGGAYEGAYGVGNPDPLTLDPKTRYKMMRSQDRYSSVAKNNLWGGGRGSAFSRLSQTEAEVKDEGVGGKAGANDLSDNMRIRMDL